MPWLAGAAVLLAALLYWADRHLPALLADELPQADRVVVEKGARRLTLMREGRPLRVYSIVLGPNPVGPKEREGDGRTPEGEYLIDWRNPASRFYRSLHLSYPTPAQRERAAEAGSSPGGAIMIHGLRNGLGWLGPLGKRRDWTEGCIAVTNREIEEIWRAVGDGTAIVIRP